MKWVRLQLSLVAAAKDDHDVWLFYSKLSSIVNLVCGSAKRRSELKCTRNRNSKFIGAWGT